MVCCGVPAVDHTELVQLAEKHFSSPSLHDDGNIPKKTPCRFTGSEVGQSMYCCCSLLLYMVSGHT